MSKRFSTLQRLLRSHDQFVILSLGGGSVPGLCGNLALLSLLEELELENTIDEVWGTSAGAIVGGGWASGATVDEILSLTRGLNHRGALDVVWWRLLVSALLYPVSKELPDGLVRGREIARAIRSGLKVETFAECRLPFRCIACHDDGRACKAILREGSLLDAILASACLPGVFEPSDPFSGERRSHHDGGLVEKTPLLSPVAEHRLREDPRPVVVLATHFDHRMRQGPPRGFVSRFVRTIEVLEDQLWEHQLKEVRQLDDVTVLLLNPHFTTTGSFDFSQVDQNYMFARDAFIRQLSNVGIMTLLAQK